MQWNKSKMKRMLLKLAEDEREKSDEKTKGIPNRSPLKCIEVREREGEVTDLNQLIERTELKDITYE